MRRSQDYAVYVATEIDRWIFWGTLLGFNIGELAGWAWPGRGCLPGRRAPLAVPRPRCAGGADWCELCECMLQT